MHFQPQKSLSSIVPRPSPLTSVWGQVRRHLHSPPKRGSCCGATVGALRKHVTDAWWHQGLTRARARDREREREREKWALVKHLSQEVAEDGQRMLLAFPCTVIGSTPPIYSSLKRKGCAYVHSKLRSITPVASNQPQCTWYYGVL